MALPEDQVGQNGREAWRNNEGRRGSATSNGMMLVLGLLVAALVAWFFFSSTTTHDVDTRTSTSQSTNAGPDANRVPNPNNAPKQQ